MPLAVSRPIVCRLALGLVAFGLVASVSACAEPTQEASAAQPQLESDARELSGAATQAGPPRGLEAMPEDERRLVGTVVERAVAGSYRYLALETEGQRRWVVVSMGDAQIGEQVEINAFGRQRDFYSRRLQRGFDELLFAELVGST